MTRPLIMFSLYLMCHSSFSEEVLSGTWRFCQGPEFPGAQGALDADADPMALQYDFTAGGNYVAAYCDLAVPLRLSVVRFRLLKPEDATVTVRVTDGSGQTFQKSLSYDGMGYRDIAVNMHGWAASWGGPGDGILRQPIHTFGILLERQGLSSPEGRMMFTSVRCEESSEMESEQPAMVFAESLRSYLVSEFDADCVLARSAGDALKAGTWHIDFSAGGRASLGGSLSLFHKPVTLTLRAKASAPGAALVFHIGAHFQNFKRTVGVFDGTDQTFTFTLPPEGWEASGAAHETLHYPLRITAIAIERHECTADRLQIALDDLACETQVPPGAAITLMSELRAAPPGKEMREFTLTCSGWNLLEEDVSEMLNVSFADWDGQVVHRTDIPVTLPGGGRPRTVEYGFSVPISRRYIESRCTLESPGQRRAETLSTFTADLTEAVFEEQLPEPDRLLRPESPWGMGVYLYRYPNTPDGRAEMDRAAALAADAGVKWTREEFNYGMIEKAPGVYDLSFFDALVDTAQRHGISVYALLSYWSPFIENPYTEEGIAAWCDYARAVVSRYKDRIKHWEIYNEPNIFFWEGPKDLYPVLLERAHALIKEEDPEARVLGISTAGIDRGFIRMVLQAGAPFDDLTVHPYRSQMIERNFIRELQAAGRLVQNRPVWITEMGWSTQINGGKTEREQAQLLARAYLAGVGAGVRNMGWYNFRNDGDDPFYNEANFGVLRRDMTPKAAYRALATVCRTLPVAGETVPAWLEQGDGTQGVYALNVGENTAFWAPGGNVTLMLSHEASDPVVCNLMGEPHPVRIETTVTATAPSGRKNRDGADDMTPPRHHVALTLRQGDPVFMLGGAPEILAVETDTADTAAPDELLF